MTQKRFSTMVILTSDCAKTLLILREDFRIWGLPGGMLEPGEAPEQAALREALEETGFETEVMRFCGTYTRPRMNDIRYVYTGRITGGQALENGPETLALHWFDTHSLPEKTTPFLKEIVQDALTETDQPFNKTQHVPFSLFVTLRLMIGLRDLRNRLTGRA